MYKKIKKVKLQNLKIFHCCACHCIITSITPPISFTLLVWFGALLNLTFSVRVLGTIDFALQFHSHWYAECYSPLFFFALTVFVVSFTPFLLSVVLVDFVWVYLRLLVLLLPSTIGMFSYLWNVVVLFVS